MAILERGESHIGRSTKGGAYGKRNASLAPLVRSIHIKALLTVVLTLSALGPVCSADKGPSESEVKVAFIYNFIKFVEWPANAFAKQDTPITIGVLGDKQYASQLEKFVKGKAANGRTIEVRLLEKDKDADSCHIIFVTASGMHRFNAILGRLKDKSTLIIGETEHFIDSGGIIGFVNEDKKVRFEINIAAAKKRSIKISSQLLKLARRVKE